MKLKMVKSNIVLIKLVTFMHLLAVYHSQQYNLKKMFKHFIINSLVSNQQQLKVLI